MKEIALLISWAAWTKSLDLSQKGSRLLKFCDGQILCQKLYWRVWSVFLICHCVSRHSSYSFSFVLRSNIVAIYFLHELVYSARLFMKMASWGFCVLVFGSSGELDRPQETEFDVPGSSGTKFVMGRSTSYEDATGASTGAPMEIRSSL